MRKGFALALVLFFLIASCVIVAKPVSADSAPIGNTWAELAPMNIARSYFGAVALNGKIYAIGGCDQVATGGNEIMPASTYTGGVTGTNEVYDPNTNNWTSEALMPTPREGFAIAVYQGKIYCIGGSTQSPPYGWGGAIAVNEMYDPSTNTWQTKAPMPYPVTNFQANVIGGKVYCVGGIDVNGVGSKTNQVYNPATNTWSENAPLPTATYDYATATYNSSIYIMNGVDWYSGNGLDLTQIYNPQNDTWSSGAPPSHTETDFVADVGVSTTGINAPERIYVFGSYTQIYNPMTNSWSLGEPISPSRTGFAAVNINDQLNVIGGSTFTGDLNAEVATETEFNLTQQYTPVGYGTIRPEISILSPENQMFNESSVPLVFTLDMAVSWEGYSLDGNANVTLSGNETISSIPNGSHTITVYANDTFGNLGASQTANFTVAALHPFPTLTVSVVSGSVVVAVIAGMLVYFKKHKR